MIDFIKTVYAEGATPIPLGPEYGFGNLQTVASLIDKFRDPMFTVAGIIVVLYFLYGAFKFLSSGGDKESIAKGREMITHSIIGFVLLMMLYIVIRFINDFFGLNFPVVQGP